MLELLGMFTGPQKAHIASGVRSADGSVGVIVTSASGHVEFTITPERLDHLHRASVEARRQTAAPDSPLERIAGRIEARLDGIESRLYSLELGTAAPATFRPAADAAREADACGMDGATPLRPFGSNGHASVSPESVRAGRVAAAAEDDRRERLIGRLCKLPSDRLEALLASAAAA